jgi:hypothetical protein
MKSCHGTFNFSKTISSQSAVYIFDFKTYSIPFSVCISENALNESRDFQFLSLVGQWCSKHFSPYCIRWQHRQWQRFSESACHFCLPLEWCFFFQRGSCTRKPIFRASCPFFRASILFPLVKQLKKHRAVTYQLKESRRGQRLWEVLCPCFL